MPRQDAPTVLIADDEATLSRDDAYADLLDRRDRLRDRLDDALDDLQELDGYAVAMEVESLAGSRAHADGGEGAG